MQVVATEVITYIESQFRLGQGDVSELSRATYVVSEDNYSRVARGNRGKFKALCHLLSVLQPQPRPMLWAILLEARSAIEVALANEKSSYLDKIEFDGQSVTPLRAILGVLRQTPDEHLPIADERLTYVSDVVFRDQLLFDIAVAGSALDNREWKASIVIAGSVVEALLLTALVDSGVDEAKLNKMNLSDLIGEAAKSSIIDKSLADQLNAVRDYRNLIHPGRAIREGESCTPGKAHAMFGVLLLVDEQFTKRGSV